MKYYYHIEKIIKIYSKIDGRNIEHIDYIIINKNKFEYICNKIEKCVKNSELENDFRYFSMNWYTLENYYDTIQKEIAENNLSCSYSIDDEDGVEEAFYNVVNYLYEILVHFEYINYIDEFKSYFGVYLDL